jgi:O-antigen/teichoic acid export membrane protein
MGRSATSAEGSEVRFIRNTAVNAAGSLVGVLVTLLLTPLLIRRLGSDAYGVWVLATTLTFGVGYLSFADLGFEQAAVRYIAQARAAGDSDQVSRILSSTFTLFSGVALVLTPPLVALAGPLAHVFAVPVGLKHAATLAFAFVLAQFLFELPARAFAALLEGGQRYGVWQLTRLVQAVVTSGLMAATVLMGHGIAALGRVTLLASAITFVVSVIAARCAVPEARLSWRFVSIAELRALSRFGGQLFVFRLLSSLYRQLDKTVIGLMLTTTAVTTYEIGNKIYASAALVQSLATSALVPAVAFSREKIELLRDMLIRGTSYTLAIALPPTTAAFIFAAPLIRTWIGAGHEAATAPARWLLVALVPGFTVAVGQTMLIALGRIGPMVWMVIGWTAVNAALSLVLVGPWGVDGVIIATLIATVMLAVPLTRLFLKELGVSAHSWLRDVLLPCVPGLALQSAVGALLLPLASHASSVLGVGALAAVSMFPALAGYYVIGLRTHDRDALRGTLGRSLRLASVEETART